MGDAQKLKKAENDVNEQLTLKKLPITTSLSLNFCFRHFLLAFKLRLCFVECFAG